MTTDVAPIRTKEELSILKTRGIRAKDNPLEILGLEDLDDQPFDEVLRRGRGTLARDCAWWTAEAGLRADDLRLADYRRKCHAYALLNSFGVDILNACLDGDKMTEFIKETPYPEHGDLDWAAIYAVDLIIRAEEIRNATGFFNQELIDGQEGPCKALGHSTWGYRLEGIHPFDVSEILQSLLTLPEIIAKGYPSDVTAFAIKWQWAKWHSKGSPVLGSIKPLTKKQRSTWTAGPVPLFIITLNGPAWLVMDDADHERYTVLHHELMHGTVDIEDKREDADPVLKMKPGTVGHDTEIMGASIARFGPLHIREAYLIQAAFNNPRTAQLLAIAATEGISDPYDLDRAYAPPELVEAGSENDPLGASGEGDVGPDPFGGAP